MALVSRRLNTGLKLVFVSGLLLFAVVPPAMPVVFPPLASPDAAVEVTDEGSVAGRLGETVLWTTDIGTSPDTVRVTTRTGSYVVTESLPDEATAPTGNGRRVISARSVLTGLPAWRIISGHPDDGSFDPFYYLLGAVAQRVIIDIPSLRIVRGLDVATGRIGWETRLPDGCLSLRTTNEISDSDTDAYGNGKTWGPVTERIAGLLTRCADTGTTLLGFDVLTGALRWRRAADPADEVALGLHKGVFVVDGQTSLTVVGDDGRVLFDEAAWYPEVTVMEHAVAIYIGTSDNELRSIDRRTGRILWRRPAPARFSGISESDGHVVVSQYLNFPLTGQGVPSLETVIDPMTGRTLPSPTWVERGIIDPDAWPDPCALVTEADLRSRSARSYSVTTAPAPPQFGLPTPEICRIGFDSGISISIRLVWAARSEHAAKALLGQLHGVMGESEAHGIADTAYFYDGNRDGILLRQGTVILSVRASGDAPLAQWAAKTVARHLRGTEDG
ncbi:outer membrane protein assembly factor BamB family protein [Microbispora bryophytorum]|uniref:Pyrrolo-quinoline quinone repeat domain-containing protein n=1 Tax=Microbispora bryophytorum TaxID=1460882 RepID=A0A8H9GYN2_9ACTN|nr:PQQ-binding-like beta-propeller repeat protein [Microbispora bryophytorum]MBD3135693.1 PQQ-binding-like beta-propeller repeat protein [Microbispora bryophytorum]TQS09860.1 PQQ-binding-like beta-propeller repeat protein [Microbispora bryophytorum]GGN98960.1 hypothetical protein GCM10011574_04070 [Microbispora bryophytorum]